MNLETMLAGKFLELPIMNGAGSCKTLEDVKLLARTPCAAIVVGSATKEPRTGNEGSVFDWTEDRSLNALGLPNGGIPYYKEFLQEMVHEAHASGKLLYFSVAGFSVEEYIELAHLGVDCSVDAVEVNFGCPNVWGDGKQKRIFSFIPELIEDTLTNIRSVILDRDHRTKVFSKHSPYSDPELLKEVASILNGKPWSSLVHAVVGPNTFPNCIAFTSDGKHKLVPQVKGYAGLGGRAMKHIGLGQIQQWRDALNPDINLIGVGGIESGEDVVHYRWAGADGMQVTSALLARGHLHAPVMERIVREAYEYP